MILVTEQTAQWLLHAAERDPALAFNLFAPHACKLCDEPVVPPEQKAHVRGHRAELDRVAAKRRRDAQKRLQEANRLRREANMRDRDGAVTGDPPSPGSVASVEPSLPRVAREDTEAVAR